MKTKTSSSPEDAREEPVIRQWLAEPTPADVRAALERITRWPDVARLVVLPDVHAAGDVCVGTVVATRRLIYPSAVGGDIGCGMLAVAFDGSANQLASEDTAGRLFRLLYDRVPANRHRLPAALPANLDPTTLSDPWLSAIARRDGRVQLGTLGRGNHFLEFQADDDDRLWLCIHSGSRAVGQAVRDFHTSADRSGGQDSRSSPQPVSLDGESDAGRAYLADADWARRFADANRRSMLNATAEVVQQLFGLQVDLSTLIACDHNHVRPEDHFGERLWIHRKGAMPAAEGSVGVLPGSMGTATYHVEGRGEPESLCSSAHGAGRALSRAAARSAFSERALHRQMEKIWFDPRQAATLREEAPNAYKNIAAVLKAQRKLVKVIRQLRPVLVYKG